MSILTVLASPSANFSSYLSRRTSHESLDKYVSALSIMTSGYIQLHTVSTSFFPKQKATIQKSRLFTHIQLTFLDLLHQDLVDHFRVGFPTGLLHDVPYQEADGPVFTSLEVVDRLLVII